MKIAYLNNMIDEQKIFIAFDTETTGLTAVDGRIVEIAALKFDLNGNILDRFSELVNPQKKIPEDVIRIHHITDDMVADMPGIDEVLPRFIAFFAGEENILIAQNAMFDIGFVNQEAIRSDIKLPRNTIIDQIDLTRRVYPNLLTYSLENTCRKFNLTDTQTHRAMADAVLVMKLFLHCLKRFENKEKTLNSLNSLYHYSFGGPMVTRIDDTMMGIVSHAVETGETLEIVYSGGSMRGKPRRIIPSIMFNRDGVTYLVAKCLIANSNKQFRLDRIKECRLINESLRV